jgi:glycine/D-amino acid oxidase-like deaminating enzyme
MATLPDKEVPYWITSVDAPPYAPLEGDLTVEAVVIGGGVAGLSAAYLLKQAGLSVAVLEKSRIGGGVSGHTTGKVTSQHNVYYTMLAKQFGTAKARAYAEANQTAIDRIEQIITSEGIDCDWQREDAYVFTEKPAEVAKLQEEARIAQSVGLPASFETSTPLPFAVRGAVRFTRQGKFHAGKYMQGLARAIHGDGSYVFEATEARGVHDGVPCRVATKRGTVTAHHVIVATNVPFPLFTHIYYGVYEYPLKSYIVAAKINKPLAGMYITPGGPLRSILPITSGGQQWLLIGGESHFPGFGIAKNRHQRLADYAKERFTIDSIDYRWSTWDYMSNDSVPLIGKLHPWSRQVYVATGFMKWGLSTSMVSGMILCDMILGKKNPWFNTFNASRFSPVAALPKAAMKIIQNLKT